MPAKLATAHGIAPMSSSHSIAPAHGIAPSKALSGTHGIAVAHGTSPQAMVPAEPLGQPQPMGSPLPSGVAAAHGAPESFCPHLSEDGTSILRAILNEFGGAEDGQGCLNPFSADVAQTPGIRLETKAPPRAGDRGRPRRVARQLVIGAGVGRSRSRVASFRRPGWLELSRGRSPDSADLGPQGVDSGPTLAELGPERADSGPTSPR